MNRLFAFVSACCVFIGGSAAALAGVPTVVTDVTILDGRGSAPKVGTVVIDGGEIGAIVPKRGKIPSNAIVISGRGKFLLPGFIDMHAHLMVPRCTASSRGSPFDRALSERMLSALLDSGITTVRSPATPTHEGLKLRDDLNGGRVRGPRALASAELINDPSLSDAPLRDYVRSALPSRPDYFKVYARLSPQQVATVIDEAHRHGVPVIGHLQKTSWRQGAELGIDYLTHAADWSEEMLRPARRSSYAEAIQKVGPMRARLTWLDLLDPDSPEVAATIAALVKHRISIDPTLVAYDSKFAGPAEARYRRNAALAKFPDLKADWIECGDSTADWTEADRAEWRRLFPKLLRLVKMMSDKGVQLTTGSDLTNEWVIPGESLHQEFELLRSAGFSPSQILRMTGENAARALKRTDIGVIEPGRRADLVLLDRSPLADISNTRSIVWVMQGGKVAFRSAGNPWFLCPLSTHC